MRPFYLYSMLLLGSIGFAQEESPSASLKDAFGDRIHIGTAVKRSHLDWQDELSRSIIINQFNSITAENLLKWESVQPKPDDFSFCASDQFVEFGEAHDMFIVGHVLVWHSQTPDWVFEDEAGNLISREALITRMSQHIETVAGRYKGRIDGWDVVNEALNDDGSFRESKWFQVLGGDFIKIAFEQASLADPEAELYYNDYNLWNPTKRDGAVALVSSLINQGIQVDGIGMQGHWSLNHPSIDQIRASIDAFLALGVKVHITELDINVLPSAWDNIGADISANFELNEQLNPYTDGLPREIEYAQAARYRELFELFLSYSQDVVRVTLWGVHDGGSWLNNWPVEGRTAYPLLFDREGQPKAAHSAIIELTEDTEI